MNKKEVAEIKKHFSDSDGLFTLNKVLTVFVGPDKGVRCKKLQLHSIIPEDEGAVILESLKKVFSGTVGKNLLEYRFPQDAYEEDGVQKLLYDLNKAKLDDEELTEKLIERFTRLYANQSAYALIIGHCSYSIMSRDKNDEKYDNVSDEYNFLTAAICPANTGDAGLVYDSDAEDVIKKSNTELIVSRAPSEGFFYPVYSERSPDVNQVMFYTRSADKPNRTVVDDVLGCRFVMSAKSEKECFKQVLSEVVGDELDYTVITSVNEKIKDVVAQSQADTETPVIDNHKLRTILSDSGVSDERLEALDTVFKETVGEAEGLTASNLIENKTVVSVPDITINIGKEAADKIRTTVIQGRRCLIIDIDEGSVSINGLNTLIPDSTQKQPASDAQSVAQN